MLESKIPSVPARLRILTGAAIALFAACQSAHAISMRHDLNWNATDNTNPYIVEGSLWDAVGFVQWNSTSTGNPAFTGTGTLVHSSVAGQFKFLTAAHNVDSEGPGNQADGIIDALSFTIYFGSSTGANGGTASGSATVAAANVAVHSFWTNGDGAGLTKGSPRYDIAVMTFAAGNVTGTLPTAMGISFADPTGQTGTMVGYGSWGNGQSFANNAGDGFRRAGRNTIDVVGTPPDNPANTGFTIQSDFDGPAGEGHTLGTNVPLSLESSTAGGDSGGPLIAFGSVVGVLNGGFPGITGGKVSEYGDRSIWASLTDSSNQTFVLGAGVAVPEPASIGLLGIAGLALLVRRRASPRGSVSL